MMKCQAGLREVHFENNALTGDGVFAFIRDSKVLKVYERPGSLFD